MNDRLTKQQLKEDPLLKTTGETVDYVQHHMKLIIGTVVGVVAILVVVLMVRASGDRSEERAAGILADARGDLARGALEPAAANLNQLLADLGGTSAGKEAQLLFADLRYNQGRYDEAEQAYRKALDTYRKDAILGTVARQGLAASLENLARYEEAAQAFQEIVDETTNSGLKSDLMLAVARNYMSSGKTAEAKVIYEEVSHDTSSPFAAQEAKHRLAELKQAG